MAYTDPAYWVGLVQAAINTVLYWVYSVVVIAVFLWVGYWVADKVVMVIRRVLDRVEIEKWVRSKGLQEALAGFTVTQVITTFVKVYIVFAFLGQGAQIAGVGFFTDLILGFLRYLPSLAQGLVLIMAILFGAAYVTNVIRREKSLFMAKQLALGLQVLIAYIAIILALPLLMPNMGAQISVLQSLLELFISALIVAFGLAFGLGIGLGIKDSVSKAAAKNQELFDNWFGKVHKK